MMAIDSCLYALTCYRLTKNYPFPKKNCLWFGSTFTFFPAVIIGELEGDFPFASTFNLLNYNFNRKYISFDNSLHHCQQVDIGKKAKVFLW